MIAVIADDLTGAAELAGIGLSYGLDVEIRMAVNPQSNAELIVIATDARSVSEPEAVQEMVNVSEALRLMKPDLIYKKVDSVLRGHIVAEVQAQLAVLGLPKALIVPANPALGRTLVDGHCYIHGERIHTTHFAEDPEFPITESDVQKRFRSASESVVVLSSEHTLPVEGIVIGEVMKQADLQDWVSRIDSQTLPGGGAGFFTAILESLQLPKRPMNEVVAVNEFRLYICGSAFGPRIELVKQAKDAGLAVSYMPNELTNSTSFEAVVLTNWVTEIATCFQLQKQVIIAIEPDVPADKTGMAIHLRTVMAMAVKQLVDRFAVHELIIEGGSTAAAVLRELGITRLVPVQELAPGVVRGRVDETAGCRPTCLYITMKPGSYHWPPGLWSVIATERQ